MNDRNLESLLRTLELGDMITHEEMSQVARILRSYKADAERYRWLNKQAEISGGTEMSKPLTKVDLDNAIEEINETAAKKILELERVDKVVQAAVLAEREACAKLCESMGVHPALNVYNGGPDWYKRQKECAAAIRARGEK